MYTTQLQLHSAKPMPQGTATRKNSALLRLLWNHIHAYLIGAAKGQGFDAFINGEAGARAGQTIVFASSSGTVGIVIGGVTVTVTWGTSDILSMTALVAAIAASTNALVQYLVEASNTRGTIALASFPAGSKVFLGQYEFKAISGTPTNYGEFDISGDDTADGAALATAINIHPQASKYFHAISAAGTCAVWQFATPPGGSAWNSNSTAATVTAAAAADTGCVRSIPRSRMANHVTTVASGTNVTAGGARLAGGAGNNVALRAGTP